MSDETLAKIGSWREAAWFGSKDAYLTVRTRDLTIIDANPAAEAFCERAREAILGQDLAALLDYSAFARFEYLARMEAKREFVLSTITLTRAFTPPVIVDLQATRYGEDDDHSVWLCRLSFLSQKNAELDLHRLNWALAAYARASRALIHFESLEDLMASLCCSIVENDEYALATVALAEQTPNKAIRLAGAAGRALAYLDGLQLSWSAEVEGGTGPTGQAIRSGEPLVMRDSQIEPLFAPWRDRARRFGLRSSVTAPFRGEDRVYGALMVYATTPNAFGPKEVRLFSQLADELSFAISVEQDREQLRIAEAGRRVAEEAARDTQAELARIGRHLSVGEFAASIAHEINQPIAAIVTNSDASLRWLARDPPNLDQARAALQRTIRDANRASEVISRTRAMLAKDVPAHGDFSLNDALQEALQFTQTEQRRAEVTVRTHLGADLPAAFGDKIQVQQVMLNLILNGIDSMRQVASRPRAMDITTGLSENGDLLVLVEDSGAGLDEATADRLFEHFFTTKSGGIGLGLPISRSIVESHGGRLWAAPGEVNGARFQFTLPAAATGRAETGAP